MTHPCVMVVATEASADNLGAALITALRGRLAAGARFVGVGGPAMAAQGIASPFDIRPLSIVGLVEGVLAYPMIIERVRQTAALARREAPDAVVLIDAWGFNLRLARALKHVSPRTMLIKYVAPQVWATRPGRAKTLAKVVDRLLTIHAFDAAYFEREGLKTTFVGNPALSCDFSIADPAGLRRNLGIGPDAPVLLVLPGSRASEVRHLMASFESAVDRLCAERPDLAVIVAAGSGVAEDLRVRLGRWRTPVHLVEGEVARLSAMKAATVALACSGTVSTELALAGCPMIIAYRLDSLSAPIAKSLLRTRFITLFNVAVQSFVAPEFVQERCSGEALAQAIAQRLDDPALRARQVEAQYAALTIMRGGIDDPIAAAADQVIDALSSVG